MSAWKNAVPVSFQEACSILERYISGVRPPAASESAPLLESDGRYLAEDIFTDRDMPPFPRATRDGFALRSSDLAELPARLPVIGELRAGADQDATRTLLPGTAIEIMTGAPLPDGADAVVMVEHTHRQDGTVIVERRVPPGENWVPKGAEAKAGQRLVPAGTRMTPADIAIAASVGKSMASVYRRPRVAILATGDELVGISEQPGPYQIRNSNSYSLAAQVMRAGGEPVLSAPIPDTRDGIENSIRDLSCDLLLLTGGVSAGKYDFVCSVLSALGAESRLAGVKMQPGKPLIFCTLPRGPKTLPVFGLPGNPVSTMVTFQLFVAPVLRALCGGTAQQEVRFVGARLRSAVNTKTGLTRFLPALLKETPEGAEVELVTWQGSGDIAAAAHSNCYLVVPPDRDTIAASEWVRVLLKDC